MKDIDKLIADLSADPKPVRPAPRPLFLFATWFLASCLYVLFLLMVACHPRPDLAQKLMQPLFASEISALVVLIAMTSLSATCLSYPDLYQHKRAVFYLPVLAFIIFAVLIFVEWLRDTPPSPPPIHHMECLLSILVMSLPPAFWMLMRLRHMASVEPARACYTALLASFSVGALALRLSEPTDSMNHLIGWHYLPMIGVVFLGVICGRKLLKW